MKTMPRIGLGLAVAALAISAEPVFAAKEAPFSLAGVIVAVESETVHPRISVRTEEGRVVVIRLHHSAVIRQGAIRVASTSLRAGDNIRAEGTQIKNTRTVQRIWILPPSRSGSR
jgi:hypothetical protein